MKDKGKTNILFVLPNFDTGGSEKLVFDIIKHIDKSKFEPVLCVFFSGKLEAEFLKLGVPFYVIHKRGIISKFGVIRCLNRIIKRHKIEVVNTHHTSPLIQGLIPFKILNRVRWIHTEHLPLEFDPNVTPTMILLSKIWLKFVDQVVGISQGVCECFKDELGVPERKIIKILNGVDIEKFHFSKDEGLRIKDEYRKKLSIKNDDVVIGTFANFRAQKNHACLLKAMALLLTKDKGLRIKDEENKDSGLRIRDGEQLTKTALFSSSSSSSSSSSLSFILYPSSLKLLLVGDGPECENIKRLIRDLKLEASCKLLGARTDIPELMAAIDIYCLPSHFEGLPFSLIEAFAAGKTVVATDVPGNRDVIQEMGQGVLVEPDNPEKLAKVLLETIEKRKEKRENPNQTQLSSVNDFPFSFAEMMNNYERIFSE